MAFKLLVNCCQNGNMNTLKDIIHKNHFDAIQLKGCFRIACKYGHYNIVRYLCELYKNDSNYEIIDINTHDTDGLIFACENGHFEIVQYLCELHSYDKNYKPICIHEGAFVSACAKGMYNERDKIFVRII